mmetsp:Transcript_9002/g.21675  ORF Transcript_9002/g.21675 Transcript_9002/m.21675 type:complete len:920 (+) Transcript_9002:391-3150(+)
MYLCFLIFFLLLEFPGADSCTVDDPCCFAALHTVVSQPGEVGTQMLYRYTTPTWMRDCLKSVRVDVSPAETTAELLKSCLRSHYVYADLVYNSTETDSALSSTAGKRVGIHSSHLRPAEDIDNVMSSSAVFDDSGRHYNAFDLLYGFARVFSRLNDYRTYFSTPFGTWVLHRVVTLLPSQVDSGEVVMLLVAAPEWDPGSREPGYVGLSEYVAVHKMAPPDLYRYLGKEVTHVNGVPADEYLQLRADAFGGFRSPGARLNDFLASSDAESLSLVPPPGTDEEVFTFSDGTQQTWKLTVVYEGESMDRGEVEAECNDSVSHDTVAGFLAALERDREAALGGAWEQGTPFRANATSALQRLEAWASAVERRSRALGEALGAPAPLPATEDGGGDGEGLTYGGEGGYYGDEGDYEDYDEAGYQSLRPASVQPGLTQVASFWDASEEPFLGVYHLGGDAVVLKIGSLGLESGPWTSEAALFRALHAAFAAADAFARERGIGNLLLDMTSILEGGTDAAAHFLLRLVHPGFGTGGECTAAEMRVSELGGFLTRRGTGSRFLVEMLRAAAPAGAEAAAGAVLRAVEAVRRSLVELLEGLGSDSAFDLLDLDIVAREAERLRRRLQGGELDDDAAARAAAAFAEDAAERLIVAAAGRSEGSLDGALKYDPASGQELKGFAWYRQRREARVRGGRWANHTQPFHKGCQSAAQQFAEIAGGAAVHRFARVVLLTDGVCVGGCSVFVTRAALSGVVRTVSIGGLPSQPPVDVSGPAGAPPDEWDFWARDTLLAAAVSALLGDPPGGAAAGTLPLPLPGAALARFAVTAEHEPLLGPRALPREFCSVPADAHAWVWARAPWQLPSASRPSAGADLLRAWREAARQFAAAPLLSPSWELRAPRAARPAAAPGSAPANQQPPPVVFMGPAEW